MRVRPPRPRSHLQMTLGTPRVLSALQRQAQQRRTHQLLLPLATRLALASPGGAVASTAPSAGTLLRSRRCRLPPGPHPQSRQRVAAPLVQVARQDAVTDLLWA